MEPKKDQKEKISHKDEAPDDSYAVRWIHVPTNDVGLQVRLKDQRARILMTFPSPTDGLF